MASPHAICGSTALVTLTARTRSSRTAQLIRGEFSSSVPVWAYPAAPARRSGRTGIRPRRPPRRSPTSSRGITSTCSRSAKAGSGSARSRMVAATFQPRSANCRASSRPMPLDVPVMRTVLTIGLPRVRFPELPTWRLYSMNKKCLVSLLGIVRTTTTQAPSSAAIRSSLRAGRFATFGFRKTDGRGGRGGIPHARFTQENKEVPFHETMRHAMDEAMDDARLALARRRWPRRTADGSPGCMAGRHVGTHIGRGNTLLEHSPAPSAPLTRSTAASSRS